MAKTQTSDGHVVDTAAVLEAARRLREAETTRQPAPPVRDLIGRDDVETAYAVQRENIQAKLNSGAKVVGRKIGLTSAAVQKQLGVDAPDFGVLLDDMAYVGGDVLPSSAVLQPRAEAEIAFVLSDDLAEGPLDLFQVRASIAYAVAAIEVCGSRIAGWDISFGDTVADNASAGAYVLGPRRRLLVDFEPATADMAMSVNNTEVSTGHGTACLGDPLEAVAWLARTSRDLGDPLREGDVILSGALGPMHPIEPGDVVHATISGLGSVTFKLGDEE